MLTFAPYVLSEATTAVIWLLMLQPGGFVDVLMHDVGLGGLVQTWLANLNIVLYTLFVVITWKYIGFRDNPVPGRAPGHTRRTEGGRGLGRGQRRPNRRAT